MNATDRGGRRAELLALLSETVPDIDDTLGANEPLVSSGRVNSLALFRLALWIEEQTSQAIDFTRIDIGEAWDTTDRILDFLERIREI